jgi:DNA polymerase
MAGEGATVGGDYESIGFAEARSALAWWLEAGVDADLQEEPRNWLKPAPPPSAKPAETAPVSNVSKPSAETLAELRDWLASSAQLPLAQAATKRILPHGPENAAVMLLSDAPRVEEAASGQPIGGDAWALTSRMLAAIGIAPDQAYSASLSCFIAPGAKMSAEERETCSEIARQHIRLAKPQRLLLFGEAVSQALLGKALPQARGHAYKVEGVRTVATFHPRSLIKDPANKSYAWKDLLLLMEDES